MNIVTNLSKWGLRFSIAIYAILHLVTSFIPNDFLLFTLAISGILIIIFTSLSRPLKSYKLPLFMLITSGLVLIYSNTPLINGILNGMLQMRNVIGLLIIIPLISWVLNEEPYVEDIMALFHKLLNTSKKFYFMLVSFTQVFSYFLLFGAISMLYEFIEIVLKDKTSKAWQKFKSTALLRGFSLAILWVISIPSFIYAVETLGAPLWIAVLQGFAFAVIGTILAVIFASFDEKHYGENLTEGLHEEIDNILKNASSKEVRIKKVIEFILLFITLFGTIFILHTLTGRSLMVLIPTVLIFWVIAFYIFKGRIKKLKPVAHGYFTQSMTKGAYQLNVMATVGILIYALNQTDFAIVIINGLNHLQSIIPLMNPLHLIPFIVILLGFFGLGPLTVMVLVAGILKSLNLPYPAHLIVLAATSGSVISTLLSPAIMPVITLSAANGLSLLTNGIKFNWKYSIAFYILVQIYIQTTIYLS